MENTSKTILIIEESLGGLVPPFEIPNIPKLKIHADTQNGGNFTLVEYDKKSEQLTIKEGLLTEQDITALLEFLEKNNFWDMEEIEQGTLKDAGWKSIGVYLPNRKRIVSVTGYSANTLPQQFQTFYDFILHIALDRVENSKTFQLTKEN